MIDEKGRLFGKFNLLDFFIILLVIAVLAVGAWMVRRNMVKGQKTDVYFTVEFNSVKDEFTQKIKDGDIIKDSIKGYYLGTVSNIEIVPDMTTSWDNENLRFIRTQVPEVKTMRIQVKAEGTVTDNDIFAENIPVKIGKAISIKGKGYAGTGYIVDLIPKPE